PSPAPPPTTADPIADVLAHSSATDNCGGTPTITASVTGGTACDPIISVVATDNCGNATTNTCTAHVDATPPSLTVNCAAISACHTNNADAIADVLAHSSATDNCGGTPTITASVTGGTACGPIVNSVRTR